MARTVIMLEGVTVSTDQLAERLTAAARRAFTRVREMHPGETFYCYALFTGDLAGHIVPTCMGENGLRQAMERERLPAAELRWWAVESPYHELLEDLGAEEFDEVTELLAERPEPYDLDDQECEEEVAERFEACFRALAALDAEGFFGTGAERDRVVVNVLRGDQSDASILANAQRLNPPAAAAWLAADLDIPEPAGDLVTLGSRGVYQVTALAYAPAAGLLVAGGSGGELHAWDLRDGGRELLAARDDEGHWRAAISPDGRTPAVTAGSRVQILDLAAGTRRDLFEGGYAALAVSPDGGTVVAADHDRTLTAVDAATGEPRWRTGGRPADCLRFAPDGRLLAAGGPGIVVLDAADGAVRHEIVAETLGAQHCVAWSAGGGRLAAGDWGGAGTVRVWEWRDGPGPIVTEFPAPEEGTNDVAFSPDGALLAAAHGDGEVHVWDLATGGLRARLRGRQEDMDAVVFVGDRRVAAAGRDVDSGPPVYIWTL